jgi:alkylation response protein AidB-like acyl-CoA dehydrogenase
MIELEPTSEQEVLLKTAQRFIDDRWPLARVRELVDGGQAPSTTYVREIGDLGWLAMFVAAEEGGGSVSGDAVGDAGLLAELRGSRLQPEPFITANVAAALLSRAADAPPVRSRLAAAAGGASPIATALGGDGLWDSGVVEAVPDGAGWGLTGDVVIAGTTAAYLLILGATGVGTSAFVVAADAPGIETRTLGGLDPSQPVTSVSLRGVKVDPLERIGLTDADLSYTRALGATLATAETVGAMAALFDMTRQYAMDRVAFGRPIGSFQALKHLLADLSVTLETSTALAAASLRSVRDETSDAEEVAAIAKIFVDERATAYTQGCLQVHGGIGFSWEHDLHLYMRRIAANRAFYGSPEHLRRRILAIHSTELVSR